MTKILALDTATDACSVALYDGETSYQRVEIAPRQHSRLLLPMVEAVLAEAELSLEKIDAVAFGQGPGSFMGVRLATAVAQGLAYGAGLPTCPISSLQALAQNAYQQQGHTEVVASWDARMGEMYIGHYQLQDGLMQAVTEDQLLPPEKLAIDAWQQAVPVGNAWHTYEDALQALPANWLEQAETKIYPEASAMLPLAEAMYLQGKTISPLLARPNYIRNRVTHGG
jgi:tRNA threonylcarbamoyladenosine biosynthesis protein TsaB